MWSLTDGSKAGGACSLARCPTARGMFSQRPGPTAHATFRKERGPTSFSTLCVFPLARAAEARRKSKARGPKTRGRLSRVIGPKARGMPLPAALPKYVWYDSIGLRHIRRPLKNLDVSISVLTVAVVLVRALDAEALL